jgi:2-dehydro-3-deoxygalactonokinase
LLNKLFSVRSLGLFEEMPKGGVKSYLSGLLIGSEIMEANLQIKEKTILRLVGNPHLSKLYSKALDFFGWHSKIEAENRTARGLARIAKSALLI